MPQIIQDALITENIQSCTAGDIWLMSVLAGENITNQCHPGQFAMTGIPGHTLRRPLSIAGINRATIQFIYRVIGNGTKELSKMDANGHNFVSLQAPIGNGFDLSAKYPILIGGGMGIVPMVYVVKSKAVKVIALGAKTNGEAKFWEHHFFTHRNSYKNKYIACEEDVDVADENNNRFFKGNIARLLPKILNEHPNIDGAYVCGPYNMEEAVVEILAKRDIPTQVSVEAHMACANGVCLGCAVNDTDDGTGRPLHVCKDGPVFRADQIFPQMFRNNQH